MNLKSSPHIFKSCFLLFTQSLINEDGEMTPFDLASPADWTPLAYTSACEALKDFGEEVNEALKLSPSPTDLETTFQVRQTWQPLAV